MPRDAEVPQRAGRLHAVTGLTDAELHALLPSFAPALVTSRHDRTIDGQPRTRRRDRAYDTCPLPTTADKLVCILTYLQPHPLQEGPGQRCGMRQSHAQTWLHGRPPVVTQTFADQDLRPARTAAAVAAMFKTHAPDARSTPPLVGLMALHGRSTARSIPKSHKHMTAGRRRSTRGTTSS